MYVATCRIIGSKKRTDYITECKIPLNTAPIISKIILKSRLTISSIASRLRRTSRTLRRRVDLIIYQHHIFCQIGWHEVNLPSISLLSSRARNIMFSITPHLFSRPPIFSFFKVWKGKCPENTFDIVVWSSLDISSPSCFQAVVVNFCEWFTNCVDENVSEDVIVMLFCTAGKVVFSGGTYS